MIELLTTILSLNMELYLKFDIILVFISIYDYMMSCSLLAFGEELGHWVKSQSRTWFSHLLLIKYDNKSWNEQF
jgi:hypothetical protein